MADDGTCAGVTSLSFGLDNETENRENLLIFNYLQANSLSFLD